MAGILRRGEQTVRDQVLHHLPIATRSVHERLDSAFARWMHRGDGQQIFGQITSRRKGVSLKAAQGFQSPKAFLNDLEITVQRVLVRRLPVRNEGQVGRFLARFAEKPEVPLNHARGVDAKGTGLGKRFRLGRGREEAPLAQRVRLSGRCRDRVRVGRIRLRAQRAGLTEEPKRRSQRERPLLT